MAALYTPLDTKRTQFRRLILLPGESSGFDDPLNGTLDMVWFDESPEYEALSYVWGPTSPAKRIVLDGKEIIITPNLDCALRHLRQPNSKRILWVDALCINQDDSEEKAHQIKLMRPIYALASGVLLWLGPGTDETDVAMRSIQKFDKEHWSTYDFQVNFMELLFRPWFTRIWVVQEFLLGWNPKENPTIGCGSVWVHWISFFAAWAHFNDGLPVIQAEYTRQYQQALSSTFELSWIDQVADIAPPTTDSLASLQERILTGLRAAFGNDFLPQTGHADVRELFEDIRASPVVWIARHHVMQRCSYESPVAKAYWRWLELKKIVPVDYCGFLMHARGTVAISQKSLSFEKILKGTMNLRSTDARDKIYGILGLVSKEAREAIPIDYHKEPAWTFVPTMSYIIKHEADGLPLLGLMWQTRHFKTPIPSWVPDFTVSADFNDEHNPVFLRGSCANASWSWRQDTTVSEDQTTLSASGISFGKVTLVVSFVDGDRKYYVDLFRKIQMLVDDRCPPGQEPLWRTLIGIRNSDPDVCKPFPQCWEMLMGRAVERGGEAQNMFQDALLPIVRKRKFFITDKGFAGVATAMISEGDTVTIIPGMVRAAVLREADPEDLGIHMKEDTKKDVRTFHRITGFAYVGCHDREEFERLEKAGPENWKEHTCLRGEMEKFYII